MPGRVAGLGTAVAEGIPVQVAGQDLFVAPHATFDIEKGQEVLLAVRAENIALGPAANAMPNKIEVIVENAVFFGSFWEYTVGLGGALSVRTRVAAGHGGNIYKVGDRIVAGWYPKDTIVVGA